MGTHAVAHALPGALASVAVIHSSPQAINTLAGTVQFNIDARAPADAGLAALEAALEERCRAVASARGVQVRRWERFWNAPCTLFDARMVHCVRESADEAGVGWREMQSGAGHDSCVPPSHCAGVRG